MKVAILGRPNVGKSSLFNAFTKTRDALVHDRPGITRDIVSGARDGITFLDTAGLEKEEVKRNMENEKGRGGKASAASSLLPLPSSVSVEATEFALAAAAEADVILFVVDARAGLHPMDAEWARKVQSTKYKVRSTKKWKIILLANKAESKKGLDNLHEFHRLGLGEPFPVSAEHNVGLGAVMEELRKEEVKEDGQAASASSLFPLPSSLKIAIMGQPNVGKSTLVNRILGERRVLVADRPGITRDVVKIPARFLDRDIEILDTAGLRRKSRVDDDIETLAALKSLNAMDSVDAVILVIDGTAAVEKQSVQIAERIYDKGLVLCVALNKWDKVSEPERDERLLKLKRSFGDGFNQIMKPLVVPISAENGAGVKNMMRRVFELWDKSNERAPTSLVNRTVEKLVKEKAPPMSRLKRPMKIKFAAHTGLHPNVITINVGGASDIPEAYTRYLRRGIATRLGWESIPVVVQYSKEENPYSDKR